MKIQNANNTSTITNLNSVNKSQMQAGMPPPPPGMFGGLGGKDQAEISKGSEFFSNLEKLKSTDPAKFKETVSSIAEKLKKAADETQDETSKARLTELSEKFQSVADGGDLSELRPPEPPSPPSTSQDTETIFNGQDQTSSDMMLENMQRPPKPDSKIRDLFNSIFSQVEKAVSS